MLFKKTLNLVKKKYKTLSNDEDDNLPAQCHPVLKSKKKKENEAKNDTV